MSFQEPVKGIESLAASVIADNDGRSGRPFCEDCANDQERLWRILTQYSPQGELLDPSCHGSYEGHSECCLKFKWAVDRAYQYALATELDWHEILSVWEDHRDYWYMNYYQPAYQPEFGGANMFVFDTLEDFRSTVGDKGFICPSCGEVSTSPYECSNEGCDWKSYGFLGCMDKGAYIFVKSEMRGEEIFMPVALAGEKLGDAS